MVPPLPPIDWGSPYAFFAAGLFVFGNIITWRELSKKTYSPRQKATIAIGAEGFIVAVIFAGWIHFGFWAYFSLIAGFCFSQVVLELSKLVR